jgi:hypothetical protein
MNVKLKRNSWHEQIAGFMDYCYTPPRNICSYFWDVVFGFIRIVTFILSVSLTIAIMIQPILYLIACLVVGSFAVVTPTIVIISSSIWALVIIFILAVILLDFFTVNFNNENKDNFIKSSYRSFNEKTCVKIDWN